MIVIILGSSRIADLARLLVGARWVLTENCCSGGIFEVLITSNVCPVWMLQLWLRDVLVRKWRQRNKTLSARTLNGPLRLTVQIKQLFFFTLFKDPVLLKNSCVLYLSTHTLRWAGTAGTSTVTKVAGPSWVISTVEILIKLSDNYWTPALCYPQTRTCGDTAEL